MPARSNPLATRKDEPVGNGHRQAGVDCPGQAYGCPSSLAAIELSARAVATSDRSPAHRDINRRSSPLRPTFRFALVHAMAIIYLTKQACLSQKGADRPAQAPSRRACWRLVLRLTASGKSVSRTRWALP